MLELILLQYIHAVIKRFKMCLFRSSIIIGTSGFGQYLRGDVTMFFISMFVLIHACIHKGINRGVHPPEPKIFLRHFPWKNKKISLYPPKFLMSFFSHWPLIWNLSLNFAVYPLFSQTIPHSPCMPMYIHTLNSIFFPPKMINICFPQNDNKFVSP